MQWVDPVQDLDGDGQFEIVVSTDDPTNGWQTHIYDALSGADLPTPIAGQIIAGTAAMEAAPTGRVLLTFSGTTLTASVFARSPSPSVTTQWSQANAAVLTYPNASQAAVQSIDANVLATDLNGDGLADIVVQDSTSTKLLGLSSAGGTVSQLGTYTLPAGANVHTAWIVSGVTISTSQVALARSDGIVNLLDNHLQPTSAGNPIAEVDIHTGGYYASGAWRELYRAPRLFKLTGGAADSVIINDSRSALVRFDAQTSSWAVPPKPAWQVTHTYGPTVVAGLNGANPGMACLALTEPVTNPPQYRARVVNADGSLGWDVVLNGIPLNDLVPGNFNGDNVPDIAIQLGSSSNADSDDGRALRRGRFFPLVSAGCFRAMGGPNRPASRSANGGPLRPTTCTTKEPALSSCPALTGRR